MSMLAATREGDGFLEPGRIRKNLDAYRRITSGKGRGWWLSEKVRLYALAESAFDSDSPDSTAFAEIHRTLRGYWQVFRNGSGWPPRRILRVLMSEACQACSRTRLDLMALGRSSDLAPLWSCLVAMSGIKVLPRGNVSPMAVSKFLHFYNPRLFPIFDRAFVRNGVFPRYRRRINASREHWSRRTSLFEAHPFYRRGLGEYLHYVLWAADCVTRVDVAETMSVFVQCYRTMLAHEGRGRGVPADLETYYATAFECALIGASADRFVNVGRAQ